ILCLYLAATMREQLIRGRTFWAKVPLVDRAARVAFDGNQLAIFVEDKLAATHAAIRANRACHLGPVNPRMHRARLVRHGLRSRSVGVFTNLTNDRPFTEQASERYHSTTFRLSGYFHSYIFLGCGKASHVNTVEL